MSEAIKAITMPKFGLSMTEGKCVGWLAEEGERIAPGDEIVEIETEKITNVYEAPEGGILRRIVAQQGETAPVGALLAVMAPPSVGEADIDAFVRSHMAKTRETAADVAAAAPAPATMNVDGLTIRYLAAGEGDGAPIVFVHGFGGDLENWQLNQPVLAERHHTIALDLPGHGGSTKTAPDGGIAGLVGLLAGFLDKAGITRAHMVGHSLGGAAVLALAASHPDRVASLTLIAPAGLGPDINGAYLAAYLAAEKRRDMKAAIAGLFADPALVSVRLVENLLRNKRLDGATAAQRKLADACFPGGRQAFALGGELARITCPVHIVWGAEDRIIPAAHAASAPESRRTVLTGTGHMAHLEKPAEINRIIAAVVSAS